MWNELKQILIDASGLGPNALHIVFAVAIFAVALLILKRPSFAFIGVAAMQLANEALDAWFDLGSGRGFRLGEAIQDTGITLAAAALCWLVATLVVKLRRA